METTMETNGKAQLLKLLELLRDTIREAGFLPRGYLYAALMEKGCTFNQYQQLEALLLADGQVRRQGDLLVWHTYQKAERQRAVID